MPERIFAIVADVPAKRERVRRMFRGAGMPAPALVHKIELPNEEAASRRPLVSRPRRMKPQTRPQRFRPDLVRVWQVPWMEGLK